MERISCTPHAIEAIVVACAAADGHPPLSEHKLGVAGTGVGGDAACWVLAGDPVVVAVVAAHRHHGAEHRAIEVAVAPPARDDEVSPLRLAASLVPPAGVHTLWAFRPEQQKAARSLGYEAFRDLLLMTRALPAPPPEPVPGYRLRSFRPGRDEDAIAAVNNLAFAGHRENSNMTADLLMAKERAPWFDAGGFLVAEDEHGITGFCWTKVLPGAIGEIYIIGVDPAHHERGLGRWLLFAGLDHLHRRLGAVIGQLWTDGDNLAVERVYRPAGFGVSLVNQEMRQAQPKG